MSSDDEVFAVLNYLRSVDLDRDMWEKSPALTAMIQTGDAQMIDFARSQLERAIETQTTLGHLAFNDPITLSVGHISGQVLTHTTVPASLGYPLLLLNELAPSDSYLKAAILQSEAALAAPRSRDGGLSMRAEGVELWIDFTYLLCPFFAKLGLVTGQTELVDEAYRQFEVHVEHLVDKDVGLPRHSWVETPNYYSQSSFWSRGIGWLGAGAIDLVSIAPEHAGASKAIAVLQNLARAMMGLQDRNGYWRNVVDDPREPFEASGTLMHAYWMAEGVSQGHLDPTHLENSRRALKGVARSIRPDGAVPGVSVPPGGPGVPLGTAAFGQGFYAQASLALQRASANA